MNKLHEVLKSIGIPFSYSYFYGKQAIPFIVYFLDKSKNFIADSEDYVKINQYIIELYTDKKSEDDETQFQNQYEQKIEEELEKNDLVWNKEEEFISDENVFLIRYTVQIIE